MSTIIRQNFAEASELALNSTVQKVLNVSYFYLNLASYFDRDDVALGNIHKYFKQLSNSKKNLADTLLKYQNARGGRTRFGVIAKPETNTEAFTVADAFAQAISIETNLMNDFYALHDVAEQNEDAHFDDFIEDDLLGTEIELLKKLGDKHAEARRAGTGLGEFIFDAELEA